MGDRATRITLLSILINGFLFVIKFAAGLISNHISAISDSLNSLLDVISSSATYYCVKVSRKEADDGHPFGHHRAEPIAGLIIAIITGIMAFEMIRTAVVRLFGTHTHSYPQLPIIALAISMAAKWVLSRHLFRIGREANSPAIRANAVDCRNDTILSFVALVGVIGTSLWSVYFDDIATLILSVWILRSGYQIGLENVEYLMGKVAPPELVDDIRERALAIEGVKELNDTLTHHVGNYIHVEIHIEVNQDLHTADSHSIGKTVQAEIESIPSVDKAFVHIDPV